MCEGFLWMNMYTIRYCIEGYYSGLVFLISFLRVRPDTGTDTTSDPPDGVLIYLYPSGSTRSLVSRQIFLPLKNRLYSRPAGFDTTPTTPISLAWSKSSFLFGYSNLFPPLSLAACFWSFALFAAIPRLLVLAIVTIISKVCLLCLWYWFIVYFQGFVFAKKSPCFQGDFQEWILQLAFCQIL